jgi:hypothetical protein
VAIAFRIASTDAATATSVNPAKPTGLADGDVLVAVSNVDANETITAPGDWTACFAQEQTGTQTVRAWYRVVPTASAEPSTYAFGGPGSVARRTTILCYSGVDNTTPMDVTPLATNNTTASVVIHAVTITTVTDNAVVVWGGCVDSSTFTVTVPAAITQRDQAVALYRMSVGDLTKTPAGATGDQDGSVSTARANVGMLIALRPYVAPTGQTAHPTSDSSLGSWTDQAGGTTNLFAVIDEAVADDADYLQSGTIAGSGDEVKVRLGALTDPSSSTGHVVRYRYQKDVAAGDQVDLVVTLYDSDGTTVIHAATHTDIANDIVAGSFTLSGAEADAITGYAAGLVLGFKRV